MLKLNSQSNLNNQNNSLEITNSTQNTKKNPGLSPGTKIGLVATGICALGYGYFTLQQPSSPTSTWGFSRSEQSTTDYTTPLIITGLISIFTTATCYLQNSFCPKKEYQKISNDSRNSSKNEEDPPFSTKSTSKKTSVADASQTPMTDENAKEILNSFEEVLKSFKEDLNRFDEDLKSFEKAKEGYQNDFDDMLSLSNEADQEAEFKKLEDFYNGLKEPKSPDRNLILEECKKVISYLSELKSPLNKDQQSLVQSFTTFLQATVITSRLSEMELWKLLPQEFMKQLFEIDRNCALNLLKTCFHISPSLECISGQRSLIIGLAFNNPVIEEAFLENFNEKSIDEPITTEDCQIIVNYLNRRNYSNPLNNEQISLVNILVAFIREKIENLDPLCETQGFSELLISGYDVLIGLESTCWRHRLESKQALEIACTCINIPSHASDNLKKIGQLIVERASKYNDILALELVLHLKNSTIKFNYENVKNHLVAYLGAEGHRIHYSLDNHLRNEIYEISNFYNDSAWRQEDTFEIKNAKYLRTFLKEVANIQNEMYQKCLLEAFEEVIQIELQRNYRWDSPLLECSVNFLIRNKNYPLALSLVKTYISSKPTNIIDFIKNTHENLVKVSNETAAELSAICKATDNEELKELF